MSRRCSVLSITLLAAQLCAAQGPAVQTGIEVLRERHFDLLRGKKVGLITNATGVDSRLRSTIDILFGAEGLTLVALFGPEHGVRSDHPAGEKIGSSLDLRTGLPVHSLYGRNRKPTPDMLRGIDVLVYDIQDIGCRSYTYISTMGLAMEAAAEQNIEFVVLDRPNPLGGQRIEGNLLEPGFESFISQYPVPYVYGLTCGELAFFLNEEGLLKGGVRCRLSVVPMKGWTRDMTFAGTRLPWVPTSPHIPTASSAAFYVAAGIIGELGVVSDGVGTTTPFQILAAEWIDEHKLADRLNALALTGIIFRPIVVKPFYGKFKDRTLRGVQLHILNERALELMSLPFLFLQTHHELYPDRDPFRLADSSRVKAFDRALGTGAVRERFSTRMKYADVKEFLRKDIAAFKARSRRHLLY